MCFLNLHFTIEHDKEPIISIFDVKNIFKRKGGKGRGLDVMFVIDEFNLISNLEYMFQTIVQT